MNEISLCKAHFQCTLHGREQTASVSVSKVICCNSWAVASLRICIIIIIIVRIIIVAREEPPLTLGDVTDCHRCKG